MMEDSLAAAVENSPNSQTLNTKQSRLGTGNSYTLKACPSPDTLPAARTYHLNLPRQFHHPGAAGIQTTSVLPLLSLPAEVVWCKVDGEGTVWPLSVPPQESAVVLTFGCKSGCGCPWQRSLQT